jgi:hypothetical protein
MWMMLILIAASNTWSASSDEPKISLDQLAPRPAAAPPAASEEQKGDGLNPMLKQKRVSTGKKKRKADVRVRGAATGGYGNGEVRTKVGEF